MTPAILTEKLLVLISPVLVRVTVRAAGEVIAAPACNVPPVKIRVLVALPLPRAVVEFAFRVPALIVVVPL